MENTPFDEHMAGTTDAEIAEWYGEKYGKDYITDTKTMTAAQINDINTEFKTDVAKSFVDDTDEVALSAREWLNENTSRGVDPTAQIDDTLAGLEQSNADMFPDNLEELDFDGPDITLNPDGSTTEKTPNMIVNENVPIEDFKIMFGGNPYETKLPKILDDLKGTNVYKRTQFMFHSLELEYQDRQKFKKLVTQQYDIFYEFLKENPDLTLKQKNDYLDMINDRVLKLDERYLKINRKNDVDLSLEELTIYDNAIEDDFKNLKNKLPSMLDEIEIQNLDFDLENALTDDEIFMRDVQPQIDDYYADMAAREPNIDNVNSYYESLNQADQELIDAHYENMIDDAQTIKVNDVPVTGKVIKQTIKNRLKKLAIGGVDALDIYELGLIGMALVEPAVQKALNPLMPMIVPGFKGKLDSKTYGQQVIENLQTTAKISPTAKAAEKFAEMPDQGEYNSYSWVGKMLDR